MESKEMPCCAMVMPKIKPLSSLGRNPLGMRMKSQTVTAMMPRENTKVMNRCRKTFCKLQS